MNKTSFVVMSMDCQITIADQKSCDKIKKIFTEIRNFLLNIELSLSPFIPTSEISQINQGKIKISHASIRTQQILALCDQTKKLSGGYFDICKNGKIDPCGLVKGWAIHQSSLLLKRRGLNNFLIEISGDLQTSGHPLNKKFWTVGIRNPFQRLEIIKTLKLSGEGVATSGNDRNGQHIYNPLYDRPIKEIISLTVIAPNVFEADRFATAAFAMGRRGIDFIESRPGLESYLIDRNRIATYTSGFRRFACSTSTV